VPGGSVSKFRTFVQANKLSRGTGKVQVVLVFPGLAVRFP
jgi:hypothetical protein